VRRRRERKEEKGVKEKVSMKIKEDMQGIVAKDEINEKVL
jgi:hypothetical protein